MKKILIALFVSLAVVGVAVADTVSTKYADGAVGTSAVAGRVKLVIFNCNTAQDAIASTGNTDSQGCYGILWNGTGTSATGATPLLHFQTGVTTPTFVLDLTKINAGQGVKFGSGIYYDEVTGSTAATIVYEN